MSDRTSDLALGSGMERILRDVLRRQALLDRRVSVIESNTGQWLPAGFRFETTTQGGQRAVVIRRVETGGTGAITDPL